MILTPILREQLRLTTLRILATNPTEYGLSVNVVLALVQSQGHPGLSLNDLAAELLYLQEAELVSPVKKVISPEMRAWRITKSGRDFLAERGIE